MFTVVIGSMGMSARADYQKGADAYRKNDYATALKQWTIAAEQGDAMISRSHIVNRTWAAKRARITAPAAVGTVGSRARR